MPIYLALAIAGAYLLAKRAIRPITEITKAAETIRAGDLSQRITGIATQDEIQELADTFNTMLHRLQASFTRERQFTADASHELRTPARRNCKRTSPRGRRWNPSPPSSGRAPVCTRSSPSSFC